MKYLIIATYTNIELTESEDSSNNTWVVGSCTTPEDAIKAVNDDIVDFIDREIESYEYEGEEAEDFKNGFNVSIFKQFAKTPNVAEDIAEVRHEYCDYIEKITYKVICTD